MIALYKGTSVLSRLIRWRTWSDYTHAAWLFQDGSVIEAWKGGVTHAPGILSAHAPDTVVHLYALNLTIEQRWAVQDFLIAQIGKPYDYAGILGFLTASKTENPNRWFCSELLFAALKQAKVNLLARIPAWKVTPGLLALSPLLQPSLAPPGTKHDVPRTTETPAPISEPGLFRLRA